MYTGLSWTILKELPGSALYYGGYHCIMRELGQNRENPNIFYQLVVGGLAGVAYQLYTYPLDTIKTNVQSGHKTVN